MRSAEGTYSDIENAQWADNLPKLLQAKIVQSFENAQQLKAVSRPIDQLEAAYKLEIGIRNFQTRRIEPAALVEFSARLIDKGTVGCAYLQGAERRSAAGRRRLTRSTKRSPGRARTGGLDRRLI